jgi:hypothetical protein
MISNKKILVISNYPIKEPLHGGQKRVAAIVDEYKKVFLKVKFVAIFVREHYPIYSNEDIYLTGKWAELVKGNHLTSDIEIGKAMINSPSTRKKIEKLLLTFKPDIIQLEQAFPYIGLKKILGDLGIKPKIVYSSQNIEAPMREEIMINDGANENDAKEAFSVISDTEIYLAKNADLLTTVSKSDGDYYRSKGAKKYVLAMNGTSPTKATFVAKLYWKKYFQRKSVKQIALFVGSGHLPNVSGFNKTIGFRVGFIPADARLVIAGGVGNSLDTNFDYKDLLSAPFWRRVINLGILKQELLEGLIEYSDIILLPIIEGGGSNLKTAEAILSNKKIVATPFAFRGYETYLKLPNIWIADTPLDFKKAIVEAFKSALKERSTDEMALANTVQWKFTLKNMVNEVIKL